MTDAVREELLRAEHSLEKGEYKIALKIVEALISSEELSVDERLACLLLEGQLRVKLGELKKALMLTEEILQAARGRENLLLLVDTLTVKAEVSWRTSELDEGLQAVEEGEQLLEEMRREDVEEKEEQIKHREGELLHQRGIIHWYKGDLDRALEYHQRSITIKEELNNKNGIADSFNNLGLVYTSKGDLDQALEYHQRSLAIREKSGIKQNIAASLNNLGIVYILKGDLDQALEYHQRSLAIRETIGIKEDMARSLVNIGVAFQLKGDLDQALKHYQRSLEINEELGIKKDIALAINNLGNIHQLKGDLDQALKHYQRSLALFKELGIKQEIALSLANVGETLWNMGDSEKALGYYQQSLTIYEEMGNDPLIAVVLFNLMQIATEREDRSLVQQYLQRLQQVNERTDNRIIDQRYRVAKALSLKTGKRVRHKMKAIEILEQVVEEEIGDHSLTVTAMIHLCDLLLSELKMTGEDELFGEIKDLTSRLLEIAEQQSSHSLLAEAYLLQSKLALIELNMGQARKFLTEAQLIAEEKGLQPLARAVAHDHDILMSQLQKWESIMDQNPSKREMIDLTGLDQFLEQMVRKTLSNLAARRHEERASSLRKQAMETKQEIYADKRIEKTRAELAYLKTGRETVETEPVGEFALPSHIKTGCKELDDLLYGGIPRNYAVILTSLSCDERDMLIERFLEAGAKEEQATLYVTARTSGLETFVEENPTNFYLFVCNPQADKIIGDMPNVIKLKGIDNLTDINIALISTIRKIDKLPKGPRRACIEVISDILLQHHTVQTRRWLNALIPDLRSKGFTTLAVIDHEMHPKQEVRAIAGIFEGEISINKRGTEKLLKIEKMTNQKYLKDELPLRMKYS